METGERTRLAGAGLAVVFLLGATDADTQPMKAGTKPASEQAGQIPDFSGLWQRDGIIMDLLEPIDGPGPLVNTSGYRTKGVGNYDHPNLKPWAAEIVKKHGEIIKSGKVAPDAHTTCNPVPTPLIMTLRDNVQLLQTKDAVTILYVNDNQVRTVWLNRPHSPSPTPSYHGESVGYYDGDTLVVDTIGLAVKPFSGIDRFGTPHTEAMHVIERYDIETVNGGRALHVDVKVEDPGTFNLPWQAWMLYYKSDDERFGEHICAENNRTDVQIPMDNNYRPPL